MKSRWLRFKCLTESHRSSRHCLPSIHQWPRVTNKWPPWSKANPIQGKRSLSLILSRCRLTHQHCHRSALQPTCQESQRRNRPHGRHANYDSHAHMKTGVCRPHKHTLEAKVSGRLVPKATNVMAVSELSIPMTHPKRLARSPMRAVTAPIMVMATKKHIHGETKLGGGMRANRSFHGRARSHMK